MKQDTASVEVTEEMIKVGKTILHDSPIVPYGENWGTIEDRMLADLFKAMYCASSLGASHSEI